MSTNPIIAALTDAQAVHDRPHTALGRAIDAWRAVDEPVRDASPQRPRTTSGGQAAKRRMKAQRRAANRVKVRISQRCAYWRQQCGGHLPDDVSAILAETVQKAAQRAKAAS